MLKLCQEEWKSKMEKLMIYFNQIMLSSRYALLIEKVSNFFLSLEENILFNSPTLPKHAYSNIPRISLPKTGNFQMKYSGSFNISAKNINCEYSLEQPQQGSSNECPQSML